MEAQKQSIVSELTARMTQVEDRIMQRIGEFEAELTNIKMSVKHVEDRVQRAEEECAKVQQLRHQVEQLSEQINDCQNALVSTDLVIRGIPVTADENLAETFNQLCRTIQHNAPPIRAIFRVHNKNNTAPVIVKLGSANDRSLLFAAVSRRCKSKRRPLSLRDIGHSADEKIYLHECLTKHNREVMQFGIELKKQKRLSSVFSIRGHVYVRVRAQSNAVRVSSIENLSSIAANNK